MIAVSTLPTAAFRREAACATTGGARHILFLFDQIRNLDGGAERSLLKITRLLPPDRYRASIATFWKPADRSFLNQFGCPVHVLPFTRCLSWESVKVARRLREIIRQEQVSIVQTFFATSDLWGGVVAKLSGCPFLVSSRRDMGFQLALKHRIGYRVLGPLFDRVHTVSEAVRTFTIQHDRVSPEKVITILNGADLAKASVPCGKAQLRAKYGFDESSQLIIDVGSIKPVKGYEVLARTAAIVCRECPGAIFLVVGAAVDPKYFEQLKSLICSLGLSNNFRFIGRCDNVFPLLQMCDAFCHLSVTDGLSNALLEAMASGLPSVISRVGGNPEVVEEGRSGFVVAAGDHELAAKRILTLLKDPDLARMIGEQARKSVELNFTAEAMVRRFIAVYDDLLGISGKAS